MRAERTRVATRDAAVMSLLRDELVTRGTAASIGCLSALAEFDEDHLLSSSADDACITLMSARGALRVDGRGPLDVYAYETLAAARDAWHCGVVLSLRAAPSSRARTRVTELGADATAVRDADRDAILFDLGVGAANIDYCVRSADARVIALLRAHSGRPLEAGGPALLEALIDASPHRVVQSACARIEVYQAIDRVATPHGPHTHLLPSLLARRRTHPATVPLPARVLPHLTLHPASPLFDGMGQRRPFDAAAYLHCETLLGRYGVPGYMDEKARVRTAIAGGEAPTSYRQGRTRAARLATRVAVRQLHHTAPASALQAAWRAHFEHRPA